MKYLSYIGAISLLLMVIGNDAAGERQTAPEVGKYAPSFELGDIRGERISFSDHKGKVILLNFWSTTCGPCKAEMPSLNNLYLKLKDKGFIVLAISVDSSERPVRTFVGERGISFPVLMDKDREVFFDRYAVLGLPTTFLIDKKGIIVDKFIGEREWDSPDIKNRILAILSER